MRGNPDLADLGFGHTSATMIVVGTPSQELALTNNAYCSASDLRKFVIHGSSSTLVLVGDSIVLSFFGHNNVADDRIALNAVQRRHIKVSAGDQISVISFFVPACFSLALLTLGLDYLNGRANINDELDAIDLAQHFRKKFNNQTWLIGGLIEINLPDENGRLQILQMHTNTMRENSFLAADVNLQEIAARTKNFTMAELEGVVRSAVSFALNRKISMDDLTKPLDEENIKVTMNDFLSALQEIIPAFGASTVDLQRCRVNGMVDCGETHKHIYERTMLFVKEVKLSRDHTIVSCLLEGPKGSGKTAMAATIGIDSDFPYAKIVSAESMIGLSESSKCAKIAKVFEDAYRSQLSIIILDDIERLLEYVPIGPHFSNLIVQTLLVLLKKLPPKGKNMLVIGTTSEVEFLKTIGICAAFSVCYHVPTLSKADFKKVLEGLNVFARDDIDAAAEALAGMPLKKLFSVVKMAARLRGNLEDIYSGEQKIDINCFYDILSEYMSIGH